MSTLYSIPLAPVPSQIVSTVLYNQQCRFAIYQKERYGLFIDIYVDDVLLLGGVICRDRVYIVRDVYFNFTGDLAFRDTVGTTDPYYTGLGSQYQFLYVQP